MNTSTKNMSTKKAFTLIELLVVISIIALLLAILMPALGKAKEKAKLLLCSSNQRQLIMGVSAYASSNDNLLPPHTTKVARANILSRRKNDDDTYQYKHLGGYLPDVEVFNCPVSRFRGDMPIEYKGETYTYQEMYRDGYSMDAQIPCSYMLYWNYVAFAFDKNGNPKDFNSDNIRGEAFIGPGKQSRNKLLVSDSFYYAHALGGASSSSWHSNHKLKGAGRSPVDLFSYFVLPGVERDFDTDLNLRSVILNAGYTDGSVSSFKSEDTIRQQAVEGWAASYIPARWK